MPKLSDSLGQSRSGNDSLLFNGQNMQQNSSSPLKLFVKAKQAINQNFQSEKQVAEETCRFLTEWQQSSSEDLVTQDEQRWAQKQVEKIKCISDVLRRDHMKVVFFGRTSNGKSTCVNAMLKEKILPMGIGHTTNCFLQIEGSDDDTAYILLEGSDEKRSLDSVTELASAISKTKLSESALIRIFWPKSKCFLLQNDVVLVDSPGVDVDENRDDWIDKHCLDADVFILVANAESTLSRTEKNFFFNVRQKLSKPNIFILNNRWDSAASEPEQLEGVKEQHTERNIEFLAEDLDVATVEQAKERVFFVSGKEVLMSYVKASQGLKAESAALADGYKVRMKDFETFEKVFQQCLSQSAVQTKFEQHAEQGLRISRSIEQILKNIYNKSNEIQDSRGTELKRKCEELQAADVAFHKLTGKLCGAVQGLTQETKQRFTQGFNSEIKRLLATINEFDYTFASDVSLLSKYKTNLNVFVEDALSRNIMARCGTDVLRRVDDVEMEMEKHIIQLVSEEDVAKHELGKKRRRFRLFFKLDIASLTTDFQEDLRFRFSLGPSALAIKFLPSKYANRLAAFGIIDCPGLIRKKSSISSASRSSERNGKPSRNRPSSELERDREHETTVDIDVVDVLAMASKASVGTFAIVGLTYKTIGWKLIAFGATLYGLAYAYERMTFTAKAKERLLKEQYAAHLYKNLHYIVDATASQCQQQVYERLQDRLEELNGMVTSNRSDLETQISLLEKNLHELVRANEVCKQLMYKNQCVEKDFNVFKDEFIKS